jgi:hypothetical protein
MKTMEITVRNVTIGKAMSGFLKTLAALRPTVMEPLNDLPREMFKYGIPYEASRTYRTVKAEFEHNKSIAMIEAHRQAVRGC